MDDLESARPPPDPVRALQIIHAALAGGVLAMMVAVIVLYRANGDAEAGAPPGSPSIAILSGVHALLALGVWAIAPLVARALMRRAAHAADDGGPALARKIARVRGAVLVQLALYESAAMFGLIVCMLASIERVLASQPIFWWNGTSAILFLAYVAVTFPTQEKLLARLPDE
ncbi:MAG: hypothetical protein U1E76_25470 [Planctomycetota bacterium]